MVMRRRLDWFQEEYDPTEDKDRLEQAALRQGEKILDTLDIDTTEWVLKWTDLYVALSMQKDLYQSPSQLKTVYKNILYNILK